MNLLENLQRTSGIQMLPLLEISSDAFAETLRLAGCNQADAVVSNGNSYIPFPFDFTFPQDSGQTSAEMKLVVGNVGSAITQDLEEWVPGKPIRAKLMLADPTNPNTIYKSWLIPISDVSTNQTSVTATCGNSKFLQQKTSKLRYDQYFSPGLF